MNKTNNISQIDQNHVLQEMPRKTEQALNP